MNEVFSVDGRGELKKHIFDMRNLRKLIINVGNEVKTAINNRRGRLQEHGQKVFGGQAVGEFRWSFFGITVDDVAVNMAIIKGIVINRRTGRGGGHGIIVKERLFGPK